MGSPVAFLGTKQDDGGVGILPIFDHNFSTVMDKIQDSIEDQTWVITSDLSCLPIYMISEGVITKEEMDTWFRDKNNPNRLSLLIVVGDELSNAYFDHPNPTAQIDDQAKSFYGIEHTAFKEALTPGSDTYASPCGLSFNHVAPDANIQVTHAATVSRPQSVAPKGTTSLIASPATLG